MSVEVGFRLGGLTQLLEAERTFGAKTEGVLTEKLHGVGQKIAQDTSRRYQPYSEVGAQTVTEKVFTTGLWVVQTRKKSRDPRKQRPNFGPLMMRKAFLPSARENEEYAVREAAAAVEEAAALYWEGR